MFEWHALGHVPLSASYTQPRLAADNRTQVWDWFHINSIDLEPDQNLLISSRNTWGVYQVGHTFGEVLWTLGGKPARSRSVRVCTSPGSTTRRVCPTARSRSSTTRTRRAGAAFPRDRRRPRLTRSGPRRCCTPTWTRRCVLSPSQGDVQQLANGDQLVGWGQIGLISELSPDDVADLRADAADERRSPTAPTASPGGRSRRPRLRSRHDARPGRRHGARGELERGDRRRRLAGPRGQRPDGARAGRLAGREHRLRDSRSRSRATAPYFAVEALGPSGQVLASSPARRRRVAS